ncbi:MULTISPECIES: hypothetical protein [Streptomyces]
MPSTAAPWDARSGEWLADDPNTSAGGASPGTGFGTAPSVRPGPVHGPAGRPRRAALSSASAPATTGEAARDDHTPAGPRGGKEARPGVTLDRERAEPAPGARRRSVDPVKALLHRHRELCERAVDPLEIAAGLEAHGVTDRTAARFRHRDVFSLAEELYARVPRDAEPRPAPHPLPVPHVRVGWVLLTLLPGVLGAATVTGLRLTHGHARPLVALGGLLAVALAVRAALRQGPLAGPPAPRAWRTTAGTRAWTLFLLGYALAGDGLLRAVLAGGPDAPPTGAADGPWPTATAPAVALLLAFAPAACSAHLLAAGARRRLAGSRGLDEFAAAARPLLLGAFALFLGALGALLALCGTALHEPAACPQALTLGALLLLARLLIVHRHRHAPALALAAAAATEAVALALPVAGRLPGCAFLAIPVETLVDTAGEAAVPALACGLAALALLWHAGRTLARASAHAPAGAPE